MSSGFAERNWKPRRRRASSGGSARSRSAFLEQRPAPLKDFLFLLELGRRAGLLHVALQPFQPAFDDPEIREDDLVFHRTHIARGID
jgi:hypothetical protein